MRHHAGSWIEYRLWKSFDFTYAYVSNIFVEDNTHTWFAYTDGYDTSGVLRLDDGGTPTNMVDDSLTNYPRSIHGDAEIALDSLADSGSVTMSACSAIPRTNGRRFDHMAQPAI